MAYQTHRACALIPARGGSKGVPRKNVRMVAGRPLIAYTIEQALASRYIDGVYVSTDDAEIKAVSCRFGAEVIDRPHHLAGDASTTVDAMKHAVEFLEKVRGVHTEHLVLLQPTTPLRKIDDIDEAIDLYFREQADAVVSVMEAPHAHHPLWAKTIVDGRLELMFADGVRAKRRQDLPPVYWHNGQIYIISRKSLFEHGDFYAGRCLPYVCHEENFVNIDTEKDLKRAESLLITEREKQCRDMVFSIGDRQVGTGHPCFVIAEAGVNHNGDMNLALALVDAAAVAGADAVKFQFFDPAGVATAEVPMADYQKERVEEVQSQQEMLAGLAISLDDVARLKAYAEEKRLIFLCTSHSGIREYQKLDELGILAHKVGSGDLLNLPVLRYLAGTGKPIILGTGMADMTEVKDAHKVLLESGNEKIAFLHCTTEYPCPYENVNMNALLSMQRDLPCVVGYSDHTAGVEIAIMAVAMGACVLEKHFTLDRSLPGPDHQASLVPEELGAMVDGIRHVESARGEMRKKPAPNERRIAMVARKSLVYGRDLAKGAVIGEGDIAVKRPGTGISPLRYDDMLGRTLVRPVGKDELVAENDFDA